MNRRNFILSALGAAAMAAVPATKAIRIHDAAHHDISGGLGISPYLHDGKGHDIGFGLATVKQEGTSVLYDQGERMARALARSMRQTRAAATNRVMGKVFDDEDEEEDGYTYQTFKTAKFITG